MVEWHRKSRRKTSGGIKRTDRRSTKKLAWRGGTFSETRLDEKEERARMLGRGKSKKNQLRYAVNANVTDPLVAQKIHKVKILNVLQNDANRQYARRNVITKGAVIEVELNGKKHAKVTSRPGQQGVINAILIESIETKKPKKKKLLRKVSSKQTFEKSLNKTSPAEKTFEKSLNKTAEEEKTEKETKKESKEKEESKGDKSEKKEPKEDEIKETKEEPKEETKKEIPKDESKDEKKEEK